MAPKKISIVTPCFNEQENVRMCHEAVRDLFATKLKDYEVEHLFCDNHSTDDTVAILEEIAAGDPRVKVIVNANNFGVYRSMFNGVLNASGDAVIPFLPADLQDPPEIIPQFVRHWEEGCKVVYGQRDKREEPLLKLILRKVYYRMIRRLSSIDIPVDAGEYQLIDRKVVEALRLFDDHQPYLRGMIAACGFKAIGVKYTWKRRQKGHSKIGLSRMFDYGLNGMVSMTVFPIRLGIIIGFFLACLSMLFAFSHILLYLVTGHQLADKGIMTIIVSIFFFSGIQLFFISLIGEYVASIHSQVRKGPLVVEERRINFAGKDAAA